MQAIKLFIKFFVFLLLVLSVDLQATCKVKAIAAGFDHSLGLKKNGTVWAWGFNGHGQLGNGTNTSSNIPDQVSNLTGIKAIAAGAGFSLGLKRNGTVWAWGRNEVGQLGDGMFTDFSDVPVKTLICNGRPE